MLASVIIPTFQRPLLLLRCLDALCNQSISPSFFEIIIVSDGPDSETQKAVNSFLSKNAHAPQVQLLHTEGKMGPAAARNLGWKSSKVPYILFTDDDCIPDRNWVASYIAAFKKQETAKIAFTGKIKVPLPKRPTDFEKNTAHLETADFVTANCATTYAALELVGGFDEQFTMAWREDSDLQFSLIDHNIAILYLENALVVHPARKASWGISLKEQKKSQFNLLLFKKHPRLYKELIVAGPPKNYYLMIASFLLGIIFMLMSISTIAIFFMCFWLLLVIRFTVKRLSNTSHSLSHILEMSFTSMLIPFYSVYWAAYGYIKFRKTA